MQAMIKRFLERLGVLDSQEWVALINAGLRIVVILVIAWVVLHIAGKLIKLFKSYMSRQGGDPEQVKRVDTLARVFRYTATVVVTIVAGMLERASAENPEMKRHLTSSDVSTSLGRWKSSLTPELQSVANNAFGDVLQQFGYQV